MSIKSYFKLFFILTFNAFIFGMENPGKSSMEHQHSDEIIASDSGSSSESDKDNISTDDENNESEISNFGSINTENSNNVNSYNTEQAKLNNCLNYGMSEIYNYFYYTYLNLLIRASKNGDLDTVKNVLTKISIDSRDFEGNTALIISACYGHTHIVQYLIENNANVNSYNNYGTTALGAATYNNHHDIVKMLTEIEEATEIDIVKVLGDIKNRLPKPSIHVAEENSTQTVEDSNSSKTQPELHDKLNKDLRKPKKKITKNNPENSTDFTIEIRDGIKSYVCECGFHLSRRSPYYIKRHKMGELHKALLEHKNNSAI